MPTAWFSPRDHHGAGEKAVGKAGHTNCCWKAGRGMAGDRHSTPLDSSTQPNKTPSVRHGMLDTMGRPALRWGIWPSAPPCYLGANRYHPPLAGDPDLEDAPTNETFARDEPESNLMSCSARGEYIRNWMQENHSMPLTRSSSNQPTFRTTKECRQDAWTASS